MISNWFSIVLVFFSVVFLQGCSKEVAAVTSSGRSVFVWEEREFTEEGKISGHIEFMRSNNIKTVFAYFDLTQTNRWPTYKKALETLQANGIKVYALSGPDPDNVEVEKRGPIFDFIENLVGFNNEPGSKFEGWLIDLEPHAIRNFGSMNTAKQQRYFDLYADTIQECSRRVDRRFKFGAVIAFWYDRRQNNGTPLNQRIQNLTDFVVTMSYRQAANILSKNNNGDIVDDGIIGISTDEIAYGGRILRPVYIAVEVAPLQGEEKKITFDGCPPDQLTREISIVDRYFDSSPGYAGIVYHHLPYLRSLMAKVE